MTDTTIDMQELAARATTLGKRAAALWVDQDRVGFHGRQSAAEELGIGIPRTDDDRQKIKTQDAIIFSSVMDELHQSYMTHAPNGRRPSERDAANAWLAIQKALPDSPQIFEARQAMTAFITTMDLVQPNLARRDDRQTIAAISSADERLHKAMTGLRFALGEDAFLADLVMMGIERERQSVKAQL